MKRDSAIRLSTLRGNLQHHLTTKRGRDTEARLHPAPCSSFVFFVNFVVEREIIMQESLRPFCSEHRIHFDEEPQLLAPSRHTWLIKDILGKQWVIKSKDLDDGTPELLKNFSVLHPPFLYPQPISESDDAFLLYPYLPGRLLAEESFENPEMIDTVTEVIGRMQALMRSLVLVPFYQETMRFKGEGKGDGDDPLQSLSFSRVQDTSERQRAARHKEMADSYRWTERTVQSCWDVLQAHGLWADAPIEEYRERVHNLFALHVPVVGTNLSHVSLHPEHLLVCPDGLLGIVGWRIEPRPRFYMIYTYLAWTFFHSKKPDALEFYRERLLRNSRRAFHTEHHLVFALCLMEQLARWCRQSAGESLPSGAQRIAEAGELFFECVENTRKDEDGS